MNDTNRIINLDNEGMAVLPIEVKSQNPEILTAFNNKLTALPEWLWECTDLQFLNLGQNQIEKISENIGNLKKLQTLDLGHNRIHALPKALGKLENLSGFLYLSNNTIDK